MRRSVCNAHASNGGRSLCVQIPREHSYPLPTYWYHSKGNWLRYNFAADKWNFAADFSSFIVEIVRKTTNLGTSSHFEEVMGGIEPWLMARWKARVDFLLTLIELLFLYPLPLTRYTAKRQNSLLFGGVGQFQPRFQGEGVVPGEYLFGFEKTRRILLSDSVNCTVLFVR